MFTPGETEDEGLFILGQDDEQEGLAQKPESIAIKTKDHHLFKRLNSERQLEELLEWEFEEGAAYHVLSGGDIDSLSFLKFILRQQPLEYCAIATWCMAQQDIHEIERYLKLGRIERLDTYVGEIFKGTYWREFELLTNLHKTYGGRVAIFRNHAKTITGFGPKFDFVISSSANINHNPRAEATVITVSKDLAKQYKEFYDGIKSFEHNFDTWEPCTLKATNEFRTITAPSLEGTLG